MKQFTGLTTYNIWSCFVTLYIFFGIFSGYLNLASSQFQYSQLPNLNIVLKLLTHRWHSFGSKMSFISVSDYPNGWMKKSKNLNEIFHKNTVKAIVVYEKYQILNIVIFVSFTCKLISLQYINLKGSCLLKVGGKMLEVSCFSSE